MVDSSQNNLQPYPQILVNFLVLGGFPFWILIEYCEDYFLGHLFYPRVDVVDPSALCDNHFYPQDIGDNVLVSAVCKSPEFLYKEYVCRTIEPLEVVSPTLFL